MLSAITASFANSLTENIAAAHETMETLPKVGISMKEVTDKLTNDGVKLFADAFDQLLAAVEKTSRNPRRAAGRVARPTIFLRIALAAAVKADH